MLCLLGAMLIGCGPGRSDPPDDGPKADWLNPQRSFDEQQFLNPDKVYRPKPVIHAGESSLYGVNRRNLDLLDSYGYGGVVTNVSFNLYLESEALWESLTENVKYAIDQLGMKVWIYDELHYPSGAAGGLVLRDNPEWQARGLVNDYDAVSGGATLNKAAKYGHELVLCKAFRGTSIENIDLSTETDLMSFAASDGSIVWRAPAGSGWFVISQYAKNFYEGTHAVNNWAVLRRAISVIRDEPVRKFIQVTHEAYRSRLGEYFGNGIEAFFSDEPAMMGTYFSPPPTTPSVLDPIDPKIPLYPTVNYADDVWQDFKSAYGYDLAGRSQYLFGGSSEQARRVRWDYYQRLAKRMENSYSKQIGDWCGQNNVASSGHWLLEENIFMHPIFNGNLLRNMSHQQIPGIDLLTSYPATAVNWAATTAKFAQSAAQFNGGTQTFSEISSAFDGTRGNIRQIVGAAAVQSALGINRFASYYPFQDFTAEENRTFADCIGRLNYMTGNGVHNARTAVYYPIESIYTDTLPPMNVNESAGYGKGAVSISENFTDLCRRLVGNQIDYDFFDSENLAECTVGDGALVTPHGERFTVIVVPQTNALETASLDKILEAAAGGVSVIFQNTDNILCRSSAEADAFGRKLADLKAMNTFTTARSTASVVDSLKNKGVQTVTLGEEAFELVATEFCFREKKLYVLVNTGTRSKNYRVTVNGVGSVYRTWDIYTGTAEGIGSVEVNGKRSAFSLHIPAESALLVTVEN